jgi:DnaD/phage-associated family protein
VIIYNNNYQKIGFDMYIFEDSKTFLYSDTSVPDIFISEYLPELDGLQVKVYIYCMFLSKNRKKISETQFAKTFGISEEEVSRVFEELLEKGLFRKKGKGYVLEDIKGVEINKLYKPRTAPGGTDIDSKKSIMSTINKKFFQGIMPISWYTNIEMWFNLYKFEDDVMFALFNYCSERGLLKYSYVNAVAKNWAEAGIKNSFDLDEYFLRYRKMKDISSKISRKLKRKAPFTEYEEKYIKKWIDDYGYDMEMIDLALRNAVKISNPNLEYFHKILTEWHKKGIRTPKQVEKERAEYREKSKPGNSVQDDSMIKRKINEHYAGIRDKNEKLTLRQRQEVFKKAPEIKRFIDEITNMSIESLSMDQDKRQKTFARIETMKKKITEKLKQNGFSGNYLEDVYDCEKCKDTGVLPDGTACICRKEFVKKLKS